MSAAIASDVVPIKGAVSQPPPNNHTKADEIMDRIQGEDHRRLALLLDLRVTQLEEKVEKNGDIAQTAATDVKVVSSKVDSVLSAVDRLASRCDDHIDGDSESPNSLVSLIAKHPWLVPVTLILGAIAFGGTAFLDFVGR